MAKAWWPIASTVIKVVGLRWSDVDMFHISVTAGETSPKGIYLYIKLFNCLSPVV